MVRRISYCTAVVSILKFDHFGEVQLNFSFSFVFNHDEELTFMPGKRGRPKSFMTKSDRLEVRLSKEETYWLNFLTNKSDKTKSQIISEAIKKLYDENK